MKYRFATAGEIAVESPFSRGRGLKLQRKEETWQKEKVALFTRAWIEMPSSCVVCSIYVVAFFTRAWIEISCHEKLSSVRAVALFTRAWIEIPTSSSKSMSAGVALFTRAWIEIMNFVLPLERYLSRPFHEGVD